MTRGATSRGGRLLMVVAMAAMLAACASSGSGYGGGHVAGHPRYKVGAPYQVKGVWYYPRVDYNYDETGIASWYGERFDHQNTANGEVFDLNQLTAAHRTLPLPSIVEVTDLDNGRALRLRVNDRGPFARGRIIDVSRRAAQLLGFETAGTARVRVRILKDASIRVADLAKRNGGNSRVRVAEAPSVEAVKPAAATAPAYTRTPSPAAATPIAEPLPPPRQAHMPQAYAPPAYAPPAYTRPSYTPSPAAPIETVRAPVRVAAMPPLPDRVKIVPVHSAGHIYIQAGAFAVSANAQRVRAQVAPLGSAQVTAASINGVAVYRVRLGPVATADEADQLLARVVDRGYPGARIVVD